MFVTLFAVNKGTIFLIRKKNKKRYFYMRTCGGFDISEYYNFSTWILPWEELWSLILLLISSLAALLLVFALPIH